MIVVDTNFLVLMLDPESTQDVNGRVARVRHFVETLSKRGDLIVIPAPVISELVAGRAQKVDEVVEALRPLRAFFIQPFDTVIAIEAGERIAAAQSKVPFEERLPGWRVAMKFDAMVAATAIVRGATELYTDDKGLSKYLVGTKVRVVLVDELPLPPEPPQHEFPY